MTPNFQQADDLWNAVKHETDENSRRLKMVEFAGLLLKCAKMEDSALEKIFQTDQLTDFFIEYLEAADHISAFFRKALAGLEPDLVAGEFETQIRETEERLAEILEKSENLHIANAELLEKKNRLMAEFQKLNDSETELNNLRSLEEQTRPENMAALEQEIELLKQRTKEKRPEKERLDNEKKILGQACQAMEEMTGSLEKEKNSCVEHLLALSGDLADSLDHNWDECDRLLSVELAKLKQKNIMYHEILSKLDNNMKNLRKVVADEQVNREMYEAHFSANAEISKAMGHVSQLSEDISKSLMEFDLELKQVIEQGENAVSRIRQLNETE